MLKREVCGVRTVGLTWFEAHQLFQMMQKRSWWPVTSRREAGRVPKTNGFSSRNVFPNPLLRARSPKQWAHLSQPRTIMALALLGNPGIQILREHSLTWVPKTCLKCIQLFNVKANKEAKAVGTKVCFISEACNQGGGQTHVQRQTSPLPNWQPVGKGFLKADSPLP